MAALAIFVLAIIMAGFVMIIFDQPVQSATAYGTATYPSGVYSTTVLTFFADTWAYMGLIVLAVLSVWLYLRAQESSAGLE